MPDLEPFQNAPIREALIDIRLGGENAPSVEDLSRFVDAIKSIYPAAKKIGEIRAEFRSDFGDIDNPKISHSSSSQPLGYQCISIDQKQIVQPRINGFTFSRLRPYESWSTFKSEARRLFEMYCSFFGQRIIQRVAIRTINRLDIPNSDVDLKDWLRTGPEISPALPQGLMGFFMQIQQPYEDIKSICVINEALESPSATDSLAVILDIDLYRTIEIPQNPDLFWDLLDAMRIKKNEIFLGCITNKMRETF